MARTDSFSVDDIGHAMRVQKEMERTVAVGRRCLNRFEKIIKPRGRHSSRVREAITEVSGTLLVECYRVSHFARPTCAIVQKTFPTRRRAYVYISEMLSIGVIREGDFVDIVTETIVTFK